MKRIAYTLLGILAVGCTAILVVGDNNKVKTYTPAELHQKLDLPEVHIGDNDTLKIDSLARKEIKN